MTNTQFLILNSPSLPLRREARKREEELGGPGLGEALQARPVRLVLGNEHWLSDSQRPGGTGCP